MAFQIPYMYNSITKLCRQQAWVNQHHENAQIRILDKAKPNTENVRGLSLVAVRRMAVQTIKLPLLSKLFLMGTICCAKPGPKDPLYMQITYKSWNNM
jgi:hypothetical protein